MDNVSNFSNTNTNNNPSLKIAIKLKEQSKVTITEKEVEEKSKGALGYVHIPGMSDGPYRSIYQDMMGKYFDKKGMIIDTRFNGGGDLVADLAMFFTLRESRRTSDPAL